MTTPGTASDILVIDTSMAACNVAVYAPELAAGHGETRPMPRGQSEELVPMVNDVLNRAGRNFADIGAVVVTVGPGAFTGVRIALSAARAFGLTIGCPVLGVLSTKAIAQTVVAINAVRPDEKIMTLLDTKRGDFYAQFFTNDGADITGPMVIARDDLAAEIATHAPVVVAGDCAAFVAGVNGVRVGDVVFADPNVVARMGAAQFAAGGVGAFLPPDPVYLRGAEVSQSKKKHRTIAENQ